MEKLNATAGTTTSVGEVFEADPTLFPELKKTENAYPTEFQLISVPPDVAVDEECMQVSEQTPGKESKEKYYATAFRVKGGDSRNRVMLLLWAEEGKYWKIIAIRAEDSSAAGLTSTKIPIAPRVSETQPENFSGDPNAVKDITSFYQAWVGKRDTAGALRYVSERSYQCLAAPEGAEKEMKPAERISKALANSLSRIPQGADLSDMMSGIQPVNELVRSVDQENSKAFAMMAVPDQMADSFL